MTQSNVPSSTDGLQLLQSLKALRRFEGEESLFWQQYTEMVAQLCRAGICIAVKDGLVHEQWLAPALSGASEPAQQLLTIYQRNINKLEQYGSCQDRLDRPITGFSQPIVLLQALDSDDSAIALLLVVDIRQASQVSELMIRLQQTCDIPWHFYQSGKRTNAPLVDELLADVLDIQSILFEQKNFQLVTMTLVNELAARYGCSQVSLGWKKNDYYRCTALSHVEKFEKSTDAINRLEDIFEECADQSVELVWPPEEGDQTILAAHHKYAVEHGLKRLITLPITVGQEVVGVLSLESVTDTLSDRAVQVIRLLTSQLTPWLMELHYHQLWIGDKARVKAKQVFSGLLGPEHTLLKLLSVCMAVLLAVLIFGKWMFKVEVTANLQTDNIAYISTSYDSYVDDVFVSAGDVVSKGESLLLLDSQQLYLQEAEAQSDVVKFSREAEKARASRKIADMRIAEARKQQAEASLARVQYYLQRSELKAPFDGVVVEGDKEKLIGSPVTRGDMLFKVAHLSDLYLRLQLSERDIEHIQEGQAGKLALLSRPDELIEFEITQIIPMAEVVEGEGNMFSLRAELKTEPAAWWRPGMSGLAKINIEKRNILWILTHRTADFLHMYFWF